MRARTRILLDSIYRSNPLHGDPRSKFYMLTISPAVEARVIEKLRQEELEEARAVQSLMLPAEVLCSGAVIIAHEFQPVDIVGGDFVDYFLMDNGNVGFYVGDVSGKGLPAAMYAALAVGILRSVHKTGQSPSEILSTLNKRLMSRGGLQRHAAILYHALWRCIWPAPECRGRFTYPQRAAGSWIFQASLRACLRTRNTRL